jgi:hypothetical protein
MNKNEVIKKAKTRAIIVALISIIPLYFIVWIIGTVIYFTAGGDFGGYGTAASAGNAWWQNIAYAADYVFGIWLLFIITRYSYRSYVRKHSS